MPAKKKRLKLNDPPKPGTLEAFMDKKDFKRLRKGDIDLQKALLKARSNRSKDASKKRKAILKAFMNTTLYKIVFNHFEEWNCQLMLCSKCDGVEWFDLNDEDMKVIPHTTSEEIEGWTAIAIRGIEPVEPWARRKPSQKM